MKENKGVLILILLVLGAMGWENSSSKKASRSPSNTVLTDESFTKASTYNFKYTYKKDTLALVVKNKTYGEALKEGGKICFKHFNPKFISEEVALDVIDSCANPKY